MFFGAWGVCGRGLLELYNYSDYSLFSTNTSSRGKDWISPVCLCSAYKTEYGSISQQYSEFKVFIISDTSVQMYFHPQ